MATLESNPLMTPHSSTFNHSMSTNNQLSMITCRSSNITIDNTHAGVKSHSSSYNGGTSNIINSTNINHVGHDCIRSGALEIVCGRVINNGGVCENDHVKKIAVSTPSDKNTNIIAKDDHDHNCDNSCISTRMISSAVLNILCENDNAMKIAATAASESNPNNQKKDYDDHDYSASAAISNNNSIMHETSHIKKLINAAKATSTFENCDNDLYGIAADIRTRSQRNCKLQSPLSLDIQKSSWHMKSNNINNAVLHGWLQAMRETSPPRTMSSPNGASNGGADSYSSMSACTSSQYNHRHTESSEELQLIHKAWMAKHPSALDKLEEIVAAASGKRIAVFLDYDGTLSPIVDDPDRAFMSHQMRAIVKEVANVFPTAIISGRCKEKLHEFVQLPELYYAGSHGMDIIAPARPYHLDETRPPHEKRADDVLFQPAKEFTLVIDKVFKALEEKTKGVPGARVEHNKFCVSVHFRCVKEKHWLALAGQVHQVLKSYPSLRLTQGRKVFEIRPLIAWNKGKALDFLLKALGLGDQNTTFPIYLGDDRSDEDAFKVLNRKKYGLGILVTTVAKETNAVCSLRDPSEVGELLKRLVKWKRRRLNKYL